jgi:DNA-binding NtrC family response regulator
MTVTDRPFLGLELVGQSAAAAHLREVVRRAAPGDGGVLLVGEPGTDLASVAREIHERSHRSTPRPWQVLACAEEDGVSGGHRLFGTSVAGDSDVVRVAPGSLVALARGGTLLLQDVTELSAGLQARLARLLRDGEVRVGDTRMPLGLRLLVTASASIDEDVRCRRFRHDLHRRMAVSRIDLPALRERAADIPELADRLLQERCAATSLPPRGFTHAAHALLTALTWPRNLAELRSAIERVVATADVSVIQIEHLLPVLRIERPGPSSVPLGTLRDARLRFERDYIGAVLEQHAWRLGEVARTLGIQRPNLYRKARQLGIPLAKQSARSHPGMNQS